MQAIQVIAVPLENLAPLGPGQPWNYGKVVADSCAAYPTACAHNRQYAQEQGKLAAPVQQKVAAANNAAMTGRRDVAAG